MSGDLYTGVVEVLGVPNNLIGQTVVTTIAGLVFVLGFAVVLSFINLRWGR